MMQKKIFLIFFTLLVLTSCGSLRRGSSRMNQSPYSDDKRDDGIEVRDDQKGENNEEDDKVVVREEKVRSVDVAEADEHVFRYYVIIGSFRYIDNARTYKKELIENGFIPVILENENGLFRVSVAAYNDEQPARNNIASIRRNYDQYNDVWLLIRKQ
jgi:cell division protein FtsN